ncbi:MAG TPA: ABC transporter permease [Solirubrobacteraceae bacterium]|jgi:ABC-type dipeptide/oligopeptide/nickel transport system permease subunit
MAVLDETPLSETPVGLFGRFSRGRTAHPSRPRLYIGATILMVLVMCSVLAPVITSQSPDAQNPNLANHGPIAGHIFGTDILGRDQFSRALYGGRLTFIVVACAVLVAASIGIALGLVTGYRRGWLDSVVMRVMDGLLSFPSLILAMTIAFVLGPSEGTVIVALSVIQIPAFARVARSQALSLSRAEFVEAARACGTRTPVILVRHLLGNMTDVLLVQLSIVASQTILTEASLSFLGLGVPPPAPSWGGMLHDGYPYLQINPSASLIPGGIIFLAVLGFNLLADGLRDVFDPRSAS